MSETPKYFILLFKKENHETWRLATADSVEQLDASVAKSKDKILKRRYFEVDRLTGEMEEF